MNFDLIYKNSWKNSKTTVTFAYDVEKKCIIYQTDQHDEEIPTDQHATGFGFFQKRLNYNQLATGSGFIQRLNYKPGFNLLGFVPRESITAA